MKKFLKYISYSLLSVILILVAFILLSELVENYNYNHKYSIAMPDILGQFDIDNGNIRISGIENIINDDIASLNYNETECNLHWKTCKENRVAIIGLGNQISIFPYHKEYKMKYADKNKILFDDGFLTIGEIDLNAKTLTYTQNNTGIEHNQTRKIEIITNNKDIEKLEKKIIRKYLKRKCFRG